MMRWLQLGRERNRSDVAADHGAISRSRRRYPARSLRRRFGAAATGRRRSASRRRGVVWPHAAQRERGAVSNKHAYPLLIAIQRRDVAVRAGRDVEPRRHEVLRDHRSGVMMRVPRRQRREIDAACGRADQRLMRAAPHVSCAVASAAFVGAAGVSTRRLRRGRGRRAWFGRTPPGEHASACNSRCAHVHPPIHSSRSAARDLAVRSKIIFSRSAREVHR